MKIYFLTLNIYFLTLKIKIYIGFYDVLYRGFHMFLVGVLKKHSMDSLAFLVGIL